MFSSSKAIAAGVALVGLSLFPLAANAQVPQLPSNSVPQIAVPSQPSNQQSLTAYTTSDLNLRSGAGSEYAVIAVMPRGSQVTVQYCLSAGTWCYLQWQGYVGWASARYLSTTPPVYQPQPQVIQPQPSPPVVIYQRPSPPVVIQPSPQPQPWYQNPPRRNSWWFNFSFGG